MLRRAARRRTASAACCSAYPHHNFTHVLQWSRLQELAPMRMCRQTRRCIRLPLPHAAVRLAVPPAVSRCGDKSTRGACHCTWWMRGVPSCPSGERCGSSVIGKQRAPSVSVRLSSSMISVIARLPALGNACSGLCRSFGVEPAYPAGMHASCSKVLLPTCTVSMTRALRQRRVHSNCLHSAHACSHCYMFSR